MLRAQVITVNADITANTTWTNNNTYQLQGGFIYVTNNATLTIEPGTLIYGNLSSLVITRGAKIMAQGTPSQPIIMTSYKAPGLRAAADWGGVIVLGNATINDPAGQRLAEGGIDAVKGFYGGTNDADNSGVISYVRIEFAGIAYVPNSETNGLTMGGIGSGTTIDHVQVSYGGDDAFEWFGGTVNGKYFVAYKTVDDMFDTDYGYRGKNQFVVGISDPNIADVSGSNGFESDNDATGTLNGPRTNPTFSNLTFFGPKQTSSTVIQTNFRRAAHLRRSTQLDAFNTIFTGFPVGLKIENANTFAAATAGTLNYKNNIIAGCPQVLDSTGFPAGFTMKAWFDSNANTSLTNSTDILAIDPYNATDPDYRLGAGSPALTGASFSSTELQDAFFTPTTYRGAFGDANTRPWTDCWTEFDPANAVYTSPVQYIASSVAVTTTGATTFCNGGSVTLIADAGYAEYFWTNAAGTVVGTSATYTATASGDYKVTVYNARGCDKTSATTMVAVNSLPTAAITTTGATAFC